MSPMSGLTLVNCIAPRPAFSFDQLPPEFAVAQSPPSLPTYHLLESIETIACWSGCAGPFVYEFVKFAQDVLSPSIFGAYQMSSPPITSPLEPGGAAIT